MIVACPRDGWLTWSAVREKPAMKKLSAIQHSRGIGKGFGMRLPKPMRSSGGVLARSAARDFQIRRPLTSHAVSGKEWRG